MGWSLTTSTLELSLVASYPVITMFYQVIPAFTGFDYRNGKKLLPRTKITGVGNFFLLLFFLPHSKMLRGVGTMILFYVSSIHKLTPEARSVNKLCYSKLLRHHNPATVSSIKAIKSTIAA